MAEKPLELGFSRQGYGSGSGDGSGYGDGAGYGYGDGAGYGYGSGYGSGYGYGYGSGYGSGYGAGAGDGYGAGSGAGSGDGYGDGYGSGYCDGYGYGSGSGSFRTLFWSEIKDTLTAEWVLEEPNAEIKRELIEAMGIDQFFCQLKAIIIHTDVDGYGNPRQLLRFPIQEAEAGYLQAVRVVCPTTKRIYHLGVPAHVKTCQDAVASTFGRKGDEYHPERES